MKVQARVTDTSLDLFVADDRVGGAESGKGSGLIGLKDRIEALGGNLRVASPPGGGTTLNITVPLEPNGR